MPETVKIRLEDAKNTKFTGMSLKNSLYKNPLDIALTGDLGAGKTTFISAFIESLGGKDVLSPTFSLENRYQTESDEELIHLDLYRLEPSQIQELLEHSADHTGIRVIEWADRSSGLLENCEIVINLADEKSGRSLQVEFKDVEIPPVSQVKAWREAVALPSHIADHCEVVSKVVEQLADNLLERGLLVRKESTIRGAQVHDLLRFIDFKSNQRGYATPTPEQAKVWEEWKERFAGLRHEAAVEKFLIEEGYPEFGEIVGTHGIWRKLTEANTIEQKLLYYSDKRVALDKIVTVPERFVDFKERYKGSPLSSEAGNWEAEVMAIEAELFPEGQPKLTV